MSRWRSNTSERREEKGEIKGCVVFELKSLIRKAKALDTRHPLYPRNRASPCARFTFSVAAVSSA